jgi:hypothetical protein
MKRNAKNTAALRPAMLPIFRNQAVSARGHITEVVNLCC